MGHTAKGGVAKPLAVIMDDSELSELLGTSAQLLLGAPHVLRTLQAHWLVGMGLPGVPASKKL